MVSGCRVSGTPKWGPSYVELSNSKRDLASTGFRVYYGETKTDPD